MLAGHQDLDVPIVEPERGQRDEGVAENGLEPTGRHD
jgi:hypothetical protein